MFKLFIASSIDYEKIHLNRLINNIKETDIPLNQVIFVIGGYDEPSYEEIEGIQIYRVKYRCFEFTPMQFICKNKDIDFTYGFFTHDTVIFKNNFYKLINDIITNRLVDESYDCFSIVKNHGMSMNIGIYSKESIIKQESILLTDLYNESSDKDTLWNLKQKLVKYEDFIFNRSKRLDSQIIPLDKSIDNITTNGEKLTMLYRYFPSIGLFKVQTNYAYIKSIYPFTSFPIKIEEYFE